MEFHEVRFPAALSFGSSGGPERRTEVVTLANGFEERNTPWEHSRRRYDAGLGMRSLSDLANVVAFFEARRGRLHAFRWKDWADFTSSEPGRPPQPTDQMLGIADGALVTFRLQKTYADAAANYVRPIAKPVVGTVLIAVDGVAKDEDWLLDAATGWVTFAAPPAAGSIVTAGFAFDVPVRFDTDHLSVSVASFRAGDVPSIPVVEVRL